MLEQIVDIEKFIKCIHVSLDCNDCLVKCAMLFHTRVKKCMQQFLLTPHHSFNNIKKCVKNYEIHQCDSFHTHIIIWVAQSGVEIITNDIVAFIHATFNKATKEFIQSIYEMENTFYTIMIKNLNSTCENIKIDANVNSHSMHNHINNLTILQYVTKFTLCFTIF
jgi:hypothetical protein